MTTVAINGFGRIGKMLTKILLLDHSIEIVGINDLADIKTQAHLFKYDSIHGRFSGEVQVEDQFLILNRTKIPYSTENDPSKLKWNGVKVDIVMECTGRFTKKEDAEKHLESGVGKVIISSPSPSEKVKTILMGLNDNIIKKSDRILSNASCTTNSAGPLIKIIDDNCGIESAYITTIHSYTGDQQLHDSPHADLRRARAGALSIVPTTTGAAKAITKIFRHLEGKIGGCGIRVPVPNGSLTDVSFAVRDPKSIEEINALFKKASENELSGILEYTDEPIVSMDIVGNTHSCIFDAQLTSVIGNMIKVVGWYDNEVGYANRLVDLVKKISRN